MAGHLFLRALQGGRKLTRVSTKLTLLTARNELKCLPSRSYSLQDETNKNNCGVVGNEFVPPTSVSSDTSTPQHIPGGSPTPRHIPVMAEEVLEFLAPRNGSVILDMTFGGGGHTRRLLEGCEGVRVVCLDRDPLAHSLAQDLQREYPSQVLPLLGRFSELPTLLTRLKIEKGFFDGILMDLGVSSMQFGVAERGFMLSQDGPLDMRMDGTREPGQITAANVLSHIDEDSLYKVLKFYGGESNARTLSRALMESRHLLHGLNTTQELADVVAGVLDGHTRTDKLGRHAHPATKTFQALRILVNNELNELDYGLRLAHHYLCVNGVLVTITFHSLEDTIVKRHLQGVDLDPSPATIGLGVTKHRTALSTYTQSEMDTFTSKPWKQLTKHVLLPSQQELNNNPRARSAKLRPALRL